MRLRWSSPVVIGRTLRPLLAGALVLGSAAVVSAQTPRVEGPFSGLFGGQSGNTKVTQSLDVRGSLFGVYQDVLKPSEDLLRELDPRFRKTGTFGGAAGSVSYAYSRSARRASMFASANANAASYSVRRGIIAGPYSGTAGFNANLTRKITLSSSAFGMYSPFFNIGATGALGTLGGLGTPGIGGGFGGGGGQVGGLDQTLPGSDFGLAAALEPVIGFGSMVGVGANLSSRSSLSFAGNYQDTRLVHASNGNFSTWGSNVTFRHSITRRLALRLGYGRWINTTSIAGSQQRFSRDNYEVGVDYGDQFTFRLGRRTTLALAPAASVMQWNGQTQFRLNGSAMLNRGMGRSWSAMVGFVRSTGFVVGFQQPILSDMASVSLGGLLAPRLRWTSIASWMRGQIGFDDQGHVTTYMASSGVSLAVARPLAMYAQYAYTAYETPPGSLSVLALSQFARQSVSVGLTVFAPIFGGGRGSR